MQDLLSVAVCQMTSVDDLESNVQQIESLISKVDEVSAASHTSGPLNSDSASAPASAVRLFCFPENCLYFRVVEGEAIPSFSLEDEVFQRLSHLARARKAFLHLGSVPVRMGSAVYNASVIVSDSGEIKTSYQKIHLFDIQLEGQKPIRESDVFQHGQSTNTFEIDGWKIGQSICYDLRFSELYSQYAKEGADLILVPSAFLVKTGEAHWEVLLRARAIESQCYVVASAQAGRHQGRNGAVRETFGNSLVVEPWGAVAEKLSPDRSEGRVVTLSKAKIQKAREQIPMSQHRRISR